MAPQGAGKLVEKLAEIASAEERLVVGLMSGTSFDGIDAALVRVSGEGPGLSVELLNFVCVPFDPDLRARIGAAAADAAEIARLNLDLGEAFAAAALVAIDESGHSSSDVHLIGSHGQTIYHEPPIGGRRGVTFQIGDGDVIARRTGVVTVSDFRAADIAAGGSGAPLIPLVDWLLFRAPGEARLMLNVGGIANVTYVTESLPDLVAFDTGPGNALTDAIVGLSTRGGETFDRDGARALRGTPSGSAVEEFLAMPYFTMPPPKSTGKEMFGSDAARELGFMTAGSRAIEDMDDGAVDDLLATAILVTARSIHDSVRFLPEASPPSRVIVSGGGVRNAALMCALSDLFDPCPVSSLAELGIDPDAKEAVGFAVLASETIAGRPGNVPSATGAGQPVVLGKISPGL